MTNEAAARAARKQGTLAIQLGGLAAVLAALFIAIAGTITWFTLLLLVGGISALTVGLIKRNSRRV